MSQYNLRNPAVKRIMKEAEELRFPTMEYHAQPLEDNLFEWHFTLSGPPNTEFEGGIYHGRITLPPEYPMKPPSIILLTPNGRFETNKKICLSISGYHPETWQPSWSIRTALLAMIGFLPTHGNGAIGSLDYTPEERKELAIKSRNWKCSHCGDIRKFLFGKVTKSSTSVPPKSNEEKPLSVPNIVLTSQQNSCDEDNKHKSNLNTSESFPNKGVLETPSNFQEEAVSEHKQLQSSSQRNHNNVEVSEAGSLFGNVSLGIMWVIVILIGILISRRIIY